MTRLTTFVPGIVLTAVTTVWAADKPRAPAPETARQVLKTVCMTHATEPACQKQASLIEDEAWLVLRTACRTDTSDACKNFRQNQGGVLILDVRSGVWRAEWEARAWRLKFNVAGTPTLPLKPGSAKDLKILIEGVSPLTYSAKPGTPKEEDLPVLANLKTFLTLAATGIQGVIQTAAFSAATALVSPATPASAPPPPAKIASRVAPRPGMTSRAPAAAPSSPPARVCVPAAPQVGPLSAIVRDRNGRLLMLNQAIRGLSKELDAVEAARGRFVEQLQKVEDGATLRVASLKGADAATLESAFSTFQKAVNELNASTSQLTSCQPLLSAYATLLSSPNDADVVASLAKEVEMLTQAGGACTAATLVTAIELEAESASCSASLKIASVEAWLKRHGAAMKPLADRLFDVTSVETSVWAAVEKARTSKPQVLATVDTLKRQVEQAMLHSWNGELIPEIVVTRQNPELPWNKIQTHSIVVKRVSPYAKDLTLKHPEDETHEFKLESATGQVLGYSIGVIYTPLYESTWTAASAPDGTKVIAETKRETRAGDLAAFLNYRFMEHRPSAKPRRAQLTLDLGVGLTSGRPAFFLGPGLEIAHVLRLGAGWAPQRISVLAPVQTVNVTKVTSNDDIRTVNRFQTRNWYVTFSFALDSLSLFTKP